MCDFATQAADSAGSFLNSPLNIGGSSTTGWNAASAGLQLATTLGAGLAKKNAAAASNAATTANYNAQMNLVGTQQTQVNALATQEQSKIARSAMEERARLVTATGESGVSGNALVSQNNAIGQSQNELATTVETNRENRINQTGVQQQSIAAGANSQMRASGFDWMGAGLQIAGQGANFASTLNKRKV